MSKGSITCTPIDNGLQIVVRGDFAFGCYGEFRDAFLRLPGGPGFRYVVDLTRTTSMDSTALGILLRLREFAKGTGSTVEIEIANGSVAEQVVRTARFTDLFPITWLDVTR